MERFEQVVVHNLVGPARAVKAFLPLLRRQGKGAILHLSSIDGVNGNPRVPSYSAAKGGIGPLTNVMSYEFAKYDIRVNALATGLTVQMKEFPPEAERAMPGFPGFAYARQLNDATPLKRYGPLTDLGEISDVPALGRRRLHYRNGRDR
jgi:NAD(P)-dependent dehydrogenase (short-subunit alcohol dehydrogenase family)